MTFQTKDIRKILIIKLCCLGDILFMTPAIQSLRKAYPQAQIDWLATSWVKDLINCLPEVKRAIIWDEPYQKGFFKKAVSVFRVLKEIRMQKYDLAFIGHRSPFFPFLAWASRIPARAGFGNSLFLTHKAAFQQKSHETQRYKDVVEVLGVKSDGKTSGIELTANGTQHLKENLGLDPSKKLIAIIPGGGVNPGTSMKIKRWPSQKFTELCKRVLENKNTQIVLLGNEGDKEITQKIHKAVSNNESLKEGAGKTSIPELIALFKQCSLVIGGDTGVTYLAAACQRPTLALYGPSDPRLVAPPGSRHRYLWKKPWCSPCYDPTSVYDKSRFRGQEFICWTGSHICMKELSVDEVEKTALGMLNAKT